jgi:hypothetical protein
MIKTIGAHKITNASIDDPIVDSLLAGEKIDIFYSDPPWGDGNLKYWVTMNKKMTGREFTPLTYTALIDRITGLIKNHVHGHVFIETGKAWEAETVQALNGLVHGVRTYKLLYKSGSKMLENVLIYGVTDPSIPRMNFDPTGMSGLAVVNKCIEAVATPNGIVCDPCCGMGYSARAAVKNGMRFRGNEFNAKRLQKTIDFLEKVSK